VGLLDEERLGRWNELSVEERSRSWNAKLDLEIEAQRSMIQDLDAELASGKLSDARVKELDERLADAKDALRVFESRRRELAAITPEVAEAMSRKELTPPSWLDDPARLFSKSGKGKGKGKAAAPPASAVPDTDAKVKPTLEETDDPNVFLGPEVTDAAGKRRRWVFEQRWASEEAERLGIAPEMVMVGEIRFSKSRKIWVVSGEASRFQGGVAEMAAKMETAARMGVDAHGVTRAQFDAQTARGTGFDDVVFEVRQGKDGQPTARVTVVEVKDYGDGTVYKFTAIDDNIVTNVKRLEQRLDDLIKARRWDDIGLDEAQAKAVLQAVRERKLDIEIRTSTGTKIPAGYEAELEKTLRRKKGLWTGHTGTKDVTVRRGPHISESSLAEAEFYWGDVERMRESLGGWPEWDPPDLQQFRALATRPAGVTPKSLDEAGALMLARDHSAGVVAGPMEVAPGGRHFLDAKGPVAVVQPSRANTGSFYLPGIARQILDAAERPLPSKGGQPVLPRIVVDLGKLKSYEEQALRLYLRTSARSGNRQEALSRIVLVNGAL
jgi:hypothetical protein